MAKIFRIIYIRPFYINTPDNAFLLNDKIVKENDLFVINKNISFVVKKNALSAAIVMPNNLSIRPCVKVRISKYIRQELKYGFIKCLPLPNADIFIIFLPPVANNMPDPYILDWRNIDFTKSRRVKLNGLLEKQIFEMVFKKAA